MSIFSTQTQPIEGETLYFDIDLSNFTQVAAANPYSPGDVVEVRAIGNSVDASASDFSNAFDTDPSTGAPIWIATLDDNLRATLEVETVQNDNDPESFTFVLDGHSEHEIELMPSGHGGGGGHDGGGGAPLPLYGDGEIDGVRVDNYSSDYDDVNKIVVTSNLSTTNVTEVTEGDSVEYTVTVFNKTEDATKIGVYLEGIIGDTTSDDLDGINLPIPTLYELGDGEFSTTINVNTVRDGVTEDNPIDTENWTVSGIVTDDDDQIIELTSNTSMLTVADYVEPTFTFTQNVTSVGESETSESFGSLSVEGGEGSYSFTYNFQIGDGEVVSVPQLITVNADGTTNLEGAAGVPVDGDQDVKIWFTPEFVDADATYQTDGFSESSSMTLAILDTDGSGDPVVNPPSGGGGDSGPALSGPSGDSGGDSSDDGGEVSLPLLEPNGWTLYTPGDNLVTLDDGANKVLGLDGNDDISGMGGNDEIFGGLSNDWLHGNQGNDYVQSNQGNDIVYGGKGNDTVLGGKGDDFVSGDWGDDLIIGGKGQDELYGGIGVDDLQGWEGNDYLLGNQGNDHLQGNQGDDIVQGGKGDDIVRGGKDNDFVYGNKGDDRLYGDSGNDHLYGGEGFDTFVLCFGTDIVHDFSVGIDKIELGTVGEVEWTTTENGLLGTYEQGSTLFTGVGMDALGMEAASGF